MSQNMAIWSQVEKTDPAATKSAKVNGQQITSISGQHMIKRATELFGPVGIGWGWKVVEERFDQGGEIRNDKGEMIGREVGHTVRIALWFKRGGERGEVEQYGCTPFTYKSKWGVTTDTEAPKKSLTDAIKKALAMLGFSADIFLGLFDDRDYVAQREEEEAIAKAEDKEAEIERQKQERLDWPRWRKGKGSERLQRAERLETGAGRAGARDVRGGQQGGRQGIRWRLPPRRRQ